MRHSLNEVEVTLRKASIGAGFPVGLAEDIGRAAGWLAMRGQNGAEAGLAAIEAGFTPSAGLDNPNTRAGIDGPSALDFLNAGTERITLRGADAPLLLLGLAGVAAGDYGCGYVLEAAGGGKVAVGAAGYEGDVAALAGEDLVLTRTDGDAVAPQAPNTSGIDVEEGTWSKIVDFFGNTLVPESEESRAQGAGAGSIDND